jgi:hypothetical protein
MKQMNRRELGAALSAFAALTAIPSQSQTRIDAGAGSVYGAVLAHSEIFAFDELPVKSSPNGMETRAVFRGRWRRGSPSRCMRRSCPRARCRIRRIATHTPRCC